MNNNSKPHHLLLALNPNVFLERAPMRSKESGVGVERSEVEKNHVWETYDVGVQKNQNLNDSFGVF